MNSKFPSLLLLIASLFISVFSEEQTYVIGTDPWPPFTIVNDTVLTGIDVDVAREIEKRIPSISFRFRKIPWTRALLYMKEGKIDAITGLAKRPDREEYILYTEPPYYTNCSSRFYVRKNSGITIKTYDDLYNYTVGFVANSAYFTQFDNDTLLSKFSVTNEEQLLLMLKLGRIDVIIGTNSQVEYELSLRGFTDEIEAVEYQPNNAVHLYFGLSKKSPVTSQQQEINRVIQELVNEGVIDSIADRYFK